MNSRRNIVLFSSAPMALVLATLAAYIVLSDYREGFEIKGTPTCDDSNDTFFIQRADSWSCVAYIIAGVSIGHHAALTFGSREDEEGKPRRLGRWRRNMMTTVLYVPLLFASLVAWVGPMSMFLHGFQTRWGADLDGISMLFVIFFCLTVVIMKTLAPRLSGLQAFHRLFWGLYLIFFVAGCLIIACTEPVPRQLVMTVLIALVMAAELARCAYYRGNHAIWFVAAMTSFGIGFIVLQVKDCNARGHAVWHVMSACALPLLYVYQTREMSIQFMVPRVLPARQKLLSHKKRMSECPNPISVWLGPERIAEMQEAGEITASVRVALDIKLLNAEGRIIQAALFGAKAHEGQLRKNAARPPYFVHCARVFQLLYELPDVYIDTAVFQAALLHDTVEDTAVTLEDLEREFGKAVRDLVAEVSDDKSLPGAERKRLQVEHAPHSSPGAQLVKLADKVANVEDLATKGKDGIPVSWTLERVQEYFRWALEVTGGIRDACPPLYAKLLDMTKGDFEYLDGKRYPCLVERTGAAVVCAEDDE